MELTKRSNFTLDLTNVGGNTPVVIKKGLKAIDFIGAISTEEVDAVGKFFTIVTSATDELDGTVSFTIGTVDYIYNPSTGQITMTTSADDDDGTT